jgi:L-alanine-DL-glutamate epimerase-like enolase superfamily enzyme
MKITDVRCAILGKSPVVRILTDEGICGYAQAETWKPFLKPHVLAFREALIGEDPTLVERVMLKIRQRGGFKPWGSAVSIIETALWDIAGKAAGLPIHKLLGGKVRDKVRVYNGAKRFPLAGHRPEDYADDMRKMMAFDERFTIIKQPLGFHSSMKREVPDFFYGEAEPSPFHGAMDRGVVTEKGLRLIADCVAAMKEVAGDKVGLALDCGPGWLLADAMKLSRLLEPYDLLWIEDLLSGDYTPWVNAASYRELTRQSLVPIHTGEQIYLRQNFKELIETQAVHVIGPDPADVGGLAELKWIAEHASLHDISIAPHGTANGLLGLAALVQISATLPTNFIAFEYTVGDPAWWYDIVDGFPDPIVRDGMIEVSDRPGLGVTFVVDQARQYLREEDADFFDD